MIYIAGWFIISKKRFCVREIVLQIHGGTIVDMIRGNSIISEQVMFLKGGKDEVGTPFGEECL